MGLSKKIKGYRYPLYVIEYAIWHYHRFNSSYRDISEQLRYRGVEVSHESIRTWCMTFGRHFAHVIKKRESVPTVNTGRKLTHIVVHAPIEN